MTKFGFGALVVGVSAAVGLALAFFWRKSMRGPQGEGPSADFGDVTLTKQSGSGIPVDAVGESAGEGVEAFWSGTGGSDVALLGNGGQYDQLGYSSPLPSGMSMDEQALFLSKQDQGLSPSMQPSLADFQAMNAIESVELQSFDQQPAVQLSGAFSSGVVGKG